MRTNFTSKLKHLLLVGCLAFSTIAGFANPVIVKMNAVSTTMTLAERESGQRVELSEPVNREYSLDLNPGQYVLTAYGNDGATQNGTIVLNVTDSVTTQQFTVLTCTAYVSNKTEEGKSWNIENGDYSLNVKVNTREGREVVQTPGKSVTSDRYTFLILNGNSYNVAFEPSEHHRQKGFMTLYRIGTVTANVNVYGAIPVGGTFSITVPSDADLQLGMKFTHFTDFTPIVPDDVEKAGDVTTYTYTLANGQVYNYLTHKDGGLTHGGYFTMNVADATKCPKIGFTDADYAKHDPKAINHSVQSNNGYETGDLLLNINPRHHLRLEVGEEFLVHGMRMWEISDNSTNNYFFEPDMHYTVLDADFKPSSSVIEIDNADTHGSAWSKITAKGQGTAIVLVTYDGINLNYYNNADKKDYLGGEYWGAIWPENTGVFVVTVGDGESAVVPNMTVNEQYNLDALRLAGKYVDAEHDVFYYQDTEEGYCFTFKPEGVSAVAMASPELSETEARYSGFSTDGVTRNEDGSYTLLLKEGRNIVRMTDAAGRASYQVLRAKPCHREITNMTRSGSSTFQPGDKIKIQYSGLFHPANKIAGIYNMSAYVTYNGVPNGSSLILGSGQYTFGSAASAQAVTVEIPEDYDATANPWWIMDQGVIQVNGYGDPIGNHRNTSNVTGRSPNFTAVPHKTYFGSIPDIRIPITPMRLFNITLKNNVADAETILTCGEKTLQADEDGLYTWTYGTYNVVARKKGYRCYRGSFVINEGDDVNRVFEIEMAEGSDDMWDGMTATEVEPDAEGVYHIATGAQLAYLQQAVETYGKNLAVDIVLDNDIDLGDYDWMPVGSSSSKPFSGRFDGQGHCIKGLYLNRAADNLTALFGYVAGSSASPAEIRNVAVDGYVCGKQYVGALVGNLNAYASIDRCANYADVVGTSYVGGLVGYISSASSTAVTNSYNRGDISGTSNVGGIAGYNNPSAVIRNVYSVGRIDGTTTNSIGACVGSTTSKANVANAYAVAEYGVTDGHLLVTEQQMLSGETAYRLGEAFTQAIGTDPYPVFGSAVVYYDEATDTYYNIASGFEINVGEGSENVSVADGVVVMHVADTYVVSVTATPTAAVLPDLVWTSSDESVVSVEQAEKHNAALTALNPGTATVKVARADDPDVYDTCQVVVTAMSGICDVNTVGNTTFDIYDVTGRLVKKQADKTDLSRLAPGLYMIAADKVTYKVRVL